MVSCVGGGGSCASIDVISEEPFSQLPESDDYIAEEAKKSQTFATYVDDFNTLYFTHAIKLSVPEVGFMGRDSNVLSQASVSYNCVARLKDSAIGQ